MTAPSERVNMADDANRSSRSSRSATSTTSADILEEAFSTDSMKKFHGHGNTNTSVRRGKKTTSDTSDREEGDEESDADRELDDNEIMEEIYATDSMKRFKKKSTTSPDSTSSTSTTSTEGSPDHHRRRRRHEGGLTSIKEDKSAYNLVEGLRSFRLEKERLTRGSSGGKEHKVFTSKMA